MKTIKKLNAILLVFALAFTALSCNDDDENNGPIIPGPPTGTEMKYEVIASVNMIEKIKFKQSNNTLVDGELSVDNPLEWSKVIVVPFVYQPFLARAIVDFVNPTTTEQSYTFNIYEDGVLTQTTNGTIPADDPTVEAPVTVTRTVEYEVLP